MPNELDRSTPMALLQSALDKGLMPDQLGKLLDLQERWERNQAAKEFALSITGFQADMPAVEKLRPVYGKDESKGPQYHFASYDDIMAVAGPILSKHSIVITFDSEPVQTGVKATCRVRVGTHVESTSFTLPMPTIPNANGSQIAGAALSYAKRYALCAALNIHVKGEDTDGEGLQDGLTEKQVEELNDLFDACRAAGSEVNAERFWAYIGCTSMHDLPGSKFELAKWELGRKLKAVKK